MEQGMAQRSPLTRERMKTPRAAAIAGILFSILLTTILVLLRISVQAASQEVRAWLAGDADTQEFYQDRRRPKTEWEVTRNGD